MANRAHHWKPTSNVKITAAVQRQKERERVSARTISARPKVPSSGPYQFVIRILAAKTSTMLSTGPANATRTPSSSKDRPGCRSVPAEVRFRSFMEAVSFPRARNVWSHHHVANLRKHALTRVKSEVGLRRLVCAGPHY